MARRNYPKRGRRTRLEDKFDRDYAHLPEYPQYTTITIIPMKTIFINMDAAPWANDFHVARSENDPVAKKLIRRMCREVIA